MQVHSFTTRLIQLNNYLPYFPLDCIGQMVTALPDDEIKKILYHAMPDSWSKKMTDQGFNYLGRSIQVMSSFFETRVENLETLALPPALRSLSRKKKKKNSKKRKAVSSEDSTPQTMKNLQARRNPVNIMASAVILQTNVLYSRS